MGERDEQLDFIREELRAVSNKMDSLSAAIGTVSTQCAVFGQRIAEHDKLLDTHSRLIEQFQATISSNHNVVMQQKRYWDTTGKVLISLLVVVLTPIALALVRLAF